MLPMSADARLERLLEGLERDARNGVRAEREWRGGGAGGGRQGQGRGQQGQGQQGQGQHGQQHEHEQQQQQHEHEQQQHERQQHEQQQQQQQLIAQQRCRLPSSTSALSLSSRLQTLASSATSTPTLGSSQPPASPSASVISALNLLGPGLENWAAEEQAMWTLADADDPLLLGGPGEQGGGEAERGEKRRRAGEGGGGGGARDVMDQIRQHQREQERERSKIFEIVQKKARMNE